MKEKKETPVKERKETPVKEKKETDGEDKKVGFTEDSVPPLRLTGKSLFWRILFIRNLLQWYFPTMFQNSNQFYYEPHYLIFFLLINFSNEFCIGNFVLVCVPNWFDEKCW